MPDYIDERQVIPEAVMTRIASRPPAALRDLDPVERAWRLRTAGGWWWSGSTAAPESAEIGVLANQEVTITGAEAVTRAAVVLVHLSGLTAADVLGVLSLAASAARGIDALGIAQDVERALGDEVSEGEPDDVGPVRADGELDGRGDGPGVLSFRKRMRRLRDVLQEPGHVTVGRDDVDAALVEASRLLGVQGDLEEAGEGDGGGQLRDTLADVEPDEVHGDTSVDDKSVAQDRGEDLHGADGSTGGAS